MTTVAWDGRTLAADKRHSSGNGICVATKIKRINGSLVACVGNAAVGREMCAWFERGSKPEDFPAVQRDKDEHVGMLVVQPDGRLLKYEMTPYPIEYENQRVAIGSGGDFARGAMECGKTAAEAVAIAALFDPSTGNGVDEFSFSEFTRP